MSDQEDFRRRMEGLLGKPGSWETLDRDALKQLAFYECLRYGAARDAAMVPALGKLYAVVARRTAEEERLSLLAHVARSLATGVGGVDSFLPFIFGDPALGVIAAASLDLALFMPLEDGDPMTGPATLRRMADRAGDDAARLGMLCGLLSVGDRRAFPLLADCWKTVDAGRRGELAHFWPGFAFASTVDFLVGWMEAAGSAADFAAAAGALTALPARAGRAGVVEVERAFPLRDAGDEPPVVVLREWTIAEYGSAIAPRLLALSARDEGGTLRAALASSWGIPG